VELPLARGLDHRAVEPVSFLYTYDANGNTLSDASGKSFTWDFENRLIQAVVPGTGTTTFKYDPFGRRIYKQSPSFTSVFLYDGSNLIETTNGSGSEVAGYTQGPGIDLPVAELRSGTSSYYEQDALSSVTSLSNSAGALANTYTFDSLGNITNSTGTLRNPFQYTGREFDSETGVYYYRARYYDPTIGRFLSEDPIRQAGSADFYVYVTNRPTNAIDPTGKTIWLCTRTGFQHGNSGIGNHSYLWDPGTGENCGRGDQSGLENPSSPGTTCIPINGSSGLEGQIMSCCHHERADGGPWWVPWNIWIPWVNDCQTLSQSCIERYGLTYPGAPGGRIGCRSCKTGGGGSAF
jgi:RHS repeat-associated protein